MFTVLVALYAAMSSCSDKGSFVPDYLKFEDIIKPNVPSTVESAGNYTKQITGGYLKTTVKYGWLKVADTTEDVCGFLSCPQSGYTVLTRDFSIPSIAPGGGYTIKLESYDQDEDLIFCFSGSFTLKK